jgi:putative copper resistance protein D
LPGRPGRQMVFLLSAGSLVSLVFVAHAAMDDGWLADLHEANDAVHILAASGWIGCLIALGRVEDGRGSLGHSATLRFPSPLIEPDVPD